MPPMAEAKEPPAMDDAGAPAYQNPPQCHTGAPVALVHRRCDLGLQQREYLRSQRLGDIDVLQAFENLRHIISRFRIELDLCDIHFTDLHLHVLNQSHHHLPVKITPLRRQRFAEKSAYTQHPEYEDNYEENLAAHNKHIRLRRFQGIPASSPSQQRTKTPTCPYHSPHLHPRKMPRNTHQYWRCEVLSQALFINIFIPVTIRICRQRAVSSGGTRAASGSP